MTGTHGGKVKKTVVFYSYMSLEAFGQKKVVR